MLTPARLERDVILDPGMQGRIVDEQGNEIRILAVGSGEMQARLARQLAPLQTRIERVSRAGEIARFVSDGEIFNVAIVPVTLPSAEWWAVWGELCLLNPRPAILVYARAATFELWTSVLDLGGYDVIVEPFSEREIQKAVLRAAQSFKERPASDAAEQ